MADNLKYDTRYLEGHVLQEDMEAIYPEIEKAHNLLVNRTGPGKDYLGWHDLPETITEDTIEDIEKTAEMLRDNSDAIVIIGICGSYLGAKSIIETLATLPNRKKILYAGYNLSGDHLAYLRDFLQDKDFSINVVSKSGTTTEPAIAFRVLETLLKEKYDESQIKDRVVCTTDSEKGALKKIADKAG